MRETLFNWLGPTLAGRRCVDLFAGTGVLGFEALSRGARAVDWVERDARTARRVAATLATLQASDPLAGIGKVFHQDALAFVRSDSGNREGYDLVFLDPPFALDPWEELLPRLVPHVSVGGKVYVEAAERPPALSPPPAGWLIIRESRAGAVWFALLQREYSPDAGASDSSKGTPDP